nr:TonB-dependent receptor [Polymorphobacter sp.]
MIARLPGFSFDGGALVRGFAGASGNVLINGQRPSTKTDSLEDSLRRIAAAGVKRIDLIRGGAAGIDMQGRTLMANVILREGARTEFNIEAGARIYGDGHFGPALQFTGSRRRGDSAISGSIDYSDEQGGDQGVGDIRLSDVAGTPIRLADVTQTDIDRALKLRLQGQLPVAGGLLHLNTAFDHLPTDKLQIDMVSLSPSGPGIETVKDTRRTNAGEIGGDYAHAIGARTTAKLVVLKSQRWRDSISVAEQDGVTSDFRQERDSGETITRLTLNSVRSPRLSVEIGGEAAINFIDARTSFTEDGTAIELPNARVRVEERRGEIFALTNWQIAAPWRLETGVRAETSTISQTGKIEKSRGFTFLKPRAVLTWSPNSVFQTRLRLEREVDQLDFNDFAASANFSSGNINAGNANLEPERRWIIEAVFDRQFWNGGNIVLTLSHAALEQVVDVIPIDMRNAPGNIGNGRRELAALDVTVPLARLGMAGGLLKANATAIASSVTDPTTGEKRSISGVAPFAGGLTLSNDIPKWNSTWKIMASSGQTAREYRIDQIQTESIGLGLGASWEYRPGRGLAILAEVENVGGLSRVRTQEIHDGLRSQVPVSQIERLAVRWPAFFRVRLRKSW